MKGWHRILLPQAWQEKTILVLAWAGVTLRVGRVKGRGNRTHLIAWSRRRGHLVLDLNRKGHLWVARHSRSHWTHRLVTATVSRALLGSVLLLELSVLAVLRRLLDHAVELLLCHADYGQLAHLRVSDHSALLKELLLEAREELLLPVVSIVQVD